MFICLIKYVFALRFIGFIGLILKSKHWKDSVTLPIKVEVDILPETQYLKSSEILDS